MHRYEPAFEARDASRNAQDYVRSHMDVFWDIFKPFIPYIVILTILDVVVTSLYMPIDPETGDPYEFSLGALISSYFYTCLVISWHRLVIHGPEYFKPMNPFKPKKSELVFLGMIFLITFLFILIVAVPLGLAVFMLGPQIGAVLGVIIAIIAIKVGLKLAFYFPAKATGNDITFKESYKMTTGYVWKFLWASFWAPLKMTGVLVLYIALGFGLMVGIFYLMPFLGLYGEVVLGTLYAMPIVLFFQPIITVISITVLSNYYQLASGNKPSA